MLKNQDADWRSLLKKLDNYRSLTPTAATIYLKKKHGITVETPLEKLKVRNFLANARKLSKT